MKRQNTESGRTMLEMLGVLAIMGVIMYGAIAGIGFGVDMYKINATYNQIEELSQGIVDLYSWAPKYPEHGIPLKVLCRNNAVECNDNAHCDGGAVGDPACSIEFKTGTVTVETRDGGDGFKIRVSALTQLACERLKDMNYSNLQLNESNTSCEDGAAATNQIEFYDLNG